MNGPNWIDLVSSRDEVEYELCEKEHDKHEEDNYEDNNGNDKCDNADHSRI